MTVKQYLKRHGWNVECDTSTPYRFMNVDISFETNKGEDETEFSIPAWNEDELATLFDNFCRENNFPNNTVTAITIVQVAEIMQNLKQEEL